MPQVQQKRPVFLYKNPYAAPPVFPQILPNPLIDPRLMRPGPKPQTVAPSPFATQGPMSFPVPTSGIPQMLAPQGQDEMRISHAARRALAVPQAIVQGGAALGGNARAAQGLMADYFGPVAGQAARATGREISNAFNYLTATPNSDLERAYSAILAVEGGIDPKTGAFRTSPKGAIGPGQVMPGTGPEAAKLAGLPWDEKRFRTDPDYNRALGFAYFKEQVRRNNGDVIAGAAAYNAGPGGLQKAQQQAAKTGQPWTAFLPSETQKYIPQFIARLGSLANQFGAPAPGFNPAPYAYAAQAQDKAASLMSMPYSATFTETPLPTRPEPTPLQAPDFSKGDAAFEATRPRNPFDDPKERVRVQKQQYFKGLGQAMASLSGGEGIGTMLMKLGAGALVGRARGDELIDEREIEFEKNMQEFNRALASREDGKAQQTANALNANIQQRNQYAEQVWADSVAQIQKKQPQVVNGNLITYDRSSDDPNQWKMTVTPMGYGPQAEALINKANLGIQMGQASQAASQFAYQSQQVAARTALGLAVQMSANQDPNATAEGYLTGAAMQARAAVRTGNWRSFFNDPRRADQLQVTATQRAYQALGIQLNPNTGEPMVPLEGSSMAQFKDAFEDSMTQIIYDEAARLGQMDRLFNNPAGKTSLVTQRTGSERYSRRTDSRGRTSSSISWDMDD